MRGHGYLDRSVRRANEAVISLVHVAPLALWELIRENSLLNGYGHEGSEKLDEKASSGEPMGSFACRQAGLRDKQNLLQTAIR